MACAAPGVYIVVDVELIDTNKWLSMCFLTSDYPQGAIRDVEEFYVDRSTHKIQCPKKIAFWQKHKQALDYNIKRGVGISEEVAERHVCEYVNDLRTRTPHFFLVSDNPGMDVAVIDGILLKYGHEPLASRGPDMYAQVLCTWSYKQALAKLFHVRTPSKLFQSPAVVRLLGMHNRPARQLERRKNNVTLPHTVFRDCSVTLSSFFRCLDLTAAMAQFVHATLLTPPTLFPEPPPPIMVPITAVSVTVPTGTTTLGCMTHVHPRPTTHTSWWQSQ